MYRLLNYNPYSHYIANAFSILKNEALDEREILISIELFLSNTIFSLMQDDEGGYNAPHKIEQC
jgi:hypothetical protein